ncbi:MAG: hypothetical protein ACJ74O_09545 [Frankiaceae bacterium]
MTHRPASARLLLVATLVGAAAALTGCATHVDSVNPDDYLREGSDGMYRITTPYANSSVPPAVVYPEACQSPPSFSGAPERC